jgi:hypothetical protein
MGLLREACLNGYRGRFYNAQVLLDELYASLADRTTTRLLAQMSRMRPSSSHFTTVIFLVGSGTLE